MRCYQFIVKGCVLSVQKAILYVVCIMCIYVCICYQGPSFKGWMWLWIDLSRACVRQGMCAFLLCVKNLCYVQSVILICYAFLFIWYLIKKVAIHEDIVSTIRGISGLYVSGLCIFLKLCVWSCLDQISSPDSCLPEAPSCQFFSVHSQFFNQILVHSFYINTNRIICSGFKWLVWFKKLVQKINMEDGNTLDKHVTTYCKNLLLSLLLLSAIDGKSWYGDLNTNIVLPQSQPSWPLLLL